MQTRRHLLGAIGAGALVSSFPISAQPAPVRVAWMSPTSSSDGSPFLDELRRSLHEIGHIEGRNFSLEAYWGDDSTERIAKLAAEVVASKPQLIVAQGSTAVVMRKMTTEIPVVFGYSGDPVLAGLVESLARPGRNMTGITYMALEYAGKRIQLMKELLPSLKQIAVVANPQHPGDQAERHASQTAADVLGIKLAYFEAGSPAQLSEAMSAIEKSGSGAVVMFPVQNVMRNRERIAAWSIKHRLPVASGWTQFVEGGNLMSYGPNLRATSQRLAYYVDRILKGNKPADLPVEMPLRVELAINLKTAKALHLKVPGAIMLRAEQVIE